MGFLSCFVQSRQQHCGENRDDGDHDKKLDKRESTNFHLHSSCLMLGENM